MSKYKSQNRIIKVPRFEEEAGFTTSKERSRIMSKIKSKNTKPEITFRKELFKRGVRYRLHNKELPGRPDISNKSKKFVIFIDGEFWNGYQWNEKRETIKSNRRFWIPKIERNIQRDEENKIKLERMGYKVFRFWEHEIKKDINSCIEKVFYYLEKQ